QGPGGGASAGSVTMSAAAPVQAPRYDAPRGAPRAMAAAATQAVAVPAAAPATAINSFTELVALAGDKRDIQTKLALERDVRLVRCEDGRLEIALEASAPKGLVHDLQRKLSAWTGKRWMVTVSQEAGAPTMRAQADARQAEVERGVQ